MRYRYHRKLEHSGISGIQEPGFDVSGSAEASTVSSAERSQKLAG